MKIDRIAPFFVACALVLAACNDSSLGGDPSRQNMMTAQVNGRSWSARWDDITAVGSAGSMTVSAVMRLDGSEIMLDIRNITGPGVYRLDSSSANSAELITGNNVYRSRLLANAGQIELTRFDNEAIAGTFRFTAPAVTPSADTDAMVVVQEGTFSAARR